MQLKPMPLRPKRQRRIRSYLAAIPAAKIATQHRNLEKYVATVLIQKFELQPEQALPFMLEYNQRCYPPLTEEKLRLLLEQAKK